MKSMTGYLMLLKVLTFLLLFNFLGSQEIFAEDRIFEKAQVFYNIDEEKKISFKYLIELSTTPEFATAISQYSISFPIEDLSFNIIKSQGENLVAHRETNDGFTKLVLNLNNNILNHKNPINIEISGDIKNGDFHEMGSTKLIQLPGTISNLSVERMEIKYPKSFGDITDTNKNWKTQELGETIVIESSNIGRVVNLFWGDKIAYDFNITKTLSNAENEPTRTFDINIPKTHGNQKVVFRNIDPLPSFAYQDGEGNIFFSYKVTSGNTFDINIDGQIIISLNAQKDNNLGVFDKPVLTRTSGYWLLDNEYELNRIKLYFSRKDINVENINEMDLDTRDLFYKYAYDYVVERLQLNSVRTTSIESNLRQGANHAVQNRTSVSPEDFVDLLTAIYRSYGVPTRMIEGYVLLLNQGFYHSWLEYWDEEIGWRSVDPALQAHSGGDFFNTQFSNHTAILSRSYNYIRPRMMFFNKEEMEIKLAEDILADVSRVKDSVRLNPLKKNQDEILGILEVQNVGNTIITLQDFSNQKDILFLNQNTLQLIVPKQTASFSFVYNSEKIADKNILIKYSSTNGDEILSPLDFNIREHQYWWWDPLVTILQITSVTIIVYILYITLDKLFLWIKRYYQ